MSATDLPLPLSFFSIVVLRHAVARSFPGGLPAFELVHQPTRKTPALCILVRMSWADVENTLSQLEAAGVIAGEDAAVADMTQGAHLECPGVIFESDGAPFGARWTVRASPELEALKPDPDRMMDDSEGWATVDRRIEVDPGSIWDAYLRASFTGDGFTLNTFRPEPLGEPQEDWYDDDGELLQEHLDTEGNLLVPAELLGKPVTGYVHGEFVGTLVPVFEGMAVRLGELSAQGVGQALDALGWPLERVGEVHRALQDLANAIGQGGRPQERTRGAQCPSPPTTAPKAPVTVQDAPKPPPGLTAHQYYQWRSLHAPEEEYD